MVPSCQGYNRLVRGAVRGRARLAGGSVLHRGALRPHRERTGGPRETEEEAARRRAATLARHGARAFCINSGIHQVSIELIQNRIGLSSM